MFYFINVYFTALQILKVKLPSLLFNWVRVFPTLQFLPTYSLHISKSVIWSTPHRLRTLPSLVVCSWGVYVIGTGLSTHRRKVRSTFTFRTLSKSFLLQDLITQLLCNLSSRMKEHSI